MISNRQKKKRFVMRTLVMTLVMTLFTQFAQAQNVYMHSGTVNVPSSGSLNFYDSGGQHSLTGSYFWEKQYSHNENSTLVFKNNNGATKVTFNTFQGWSDTGYPDYTLINLGDPWSARLNDDHLFIYEGEAVDDDKLIADLTGAIKGSFTIMSQGSITFKFVSNGQYRDEGWEATVETVQSFVPQPPIIVKSECSDYVELLSASLGGEYYYTTDGNDPDPNDLLSSNTTLYTGPFLIDLDATNASVTVKAVVVYEGTATAAVASHTFTHNDQRPTPGKPTISISGNTVTFTPAAKPDNAPNESYNIRYTTDGTEPSASNGTLLTKATGFSIEWHTPNTTFKAVTLAQKSGCSDIASESETAQFGNVTVPTPTITFDNEGKATIACSLSGATVYYTTDGTQPSQTGPNGIAPVTTNALPIGTTVYAYAGYSGEGYDDSAIASAIYVPASGTGTYGGVVFLDDREDHTWSYYSDGDQPIHSLKPADVKITYKGFGENTMTSTSTANMPATSAFDTDVEEDQVAVNVGEAGNQFIYLKTLENANEDGTGNYPYTMIHNPFQVRPNNNTTTTPTARTIYFNWGRGGNQGNTAAQGTLTITYTDADGVENQTRTFNINGTGSGNITAKVGTTISYSLIKTAGSTNRYVYFTAGYNNNGTQLITQRTCSSTTTPTTGTSGNIAALDPVVTYDWRGFYAWRVKSLGGGLSIDGKEVGSIIYPDETIEFVTSNDEGNEVEFEALWAKAWVTTNTTAMSSGNYATNNGNYRNAYERNFHVVTSLPTHSTYPYTVTTINPDGSGTVGSISQTSSYACSTDMKLENMTLSITGGWGGGTVYLSANGHSLHIGRGVANGNSNVVTQVRGNTTSNFTLRVESGRYTNIYGFQGTTTSNAFTANIILGSDYDRANDEPNTKLTVTGAAQVGYNGAYLSSSSTKVNVTVLSGTFGSTSSDTELYMGFQNAQTAAQAKRTLEVYGGNFQGGIAGGIEGGNITATTEVLKMRIRGGTIAQYLYGSGQYAASYGTRKTIITGGTFTGWIAGGCYGTDQNDSGGVTNGNAYMYFGGDANQTNTTGLFGGGYGSNATGDNKYTVQKSFVVVADDATLAGSVYGGGNNGYATSDTEVWVLGGGEDKLTVSGSVYGGANLSRSGGANTVTMKGGTVNGSVYGGAQGATATTDIVYVTNLATVNIKGGNVKNNVFGGGYGASTVMRGGTQVNISGGTINNNVYGGGALGAVGRNNNTANAVVTVSGGTMNDVYGAGLGTEYTGTNWPSGSANANIYGNTTVNVSGGTIANVYGGGENGSVAHSTTATSATGKSIVTVSGGEITGDVFGGGKNGTTQGTTTVNVSNGVIRGNVFGGALGAHKRIYVTGMRTVNMTGGHVYGNVYGGSHDANDGNNLSTTHDSFTNYTGTEKISVTNISGGIIDQNVYAAGYYGRTFGSVYVFIGKDAVEKAPNHTLTTTGNVTTLNIGGTVWAGGDWGTFEGSFGGSTISGNSNIYVDGEGYETNTQQISNAQYMNIGGSILGCGTSCHAGKGERTIIIRNYGHANGTEPVEATRTLFSIQFAKVLIFDNSNINFTGQGRINSLNATEKYAIYEIYDNSKTTNTDTDVDGVRIVNGSGLFLNAPVTQIANFRSMSCEDTFASTALADYTAINPTTLSSCNNQVRVNHGIYVEVKWGSDFGALIGYAHMMASTDATDATCAYARPKDCYTTPIASNLNNPNDGGWVSYDTDLNTFNLDGSAAGTIQMPYENHTTRNGEDYFRIWRVGGVEHYREGVFDAVANGTATFSTVDVVVKLPAFRNKNNYYRFETIGDGTNTSINYGADVLTFNAANTAKPCANGNWMYYDEDNLSQVTGINENNDNTAFQKALSEIKAKPDVNFGLAILPGQGLNGSNYIICSDADANLAKNTTKFGNEDNTEQPAVTFRLTYYNKLSANMSWDPMTIVLVQCDAQGKETDRVTISLAVNTSASIEQEFTTQLYAIMQGEGSTSDTYSAKVVLPMFSLYTAGQESVFTLNSVGFEPANGGNLIARGGTYTYDDYAVEYSPGYNYDNTSGWSSPTVIGTTGDAYPMTQGHAAEVVGYAGGRTEFSIDFKLYYNGNLTATQEELIGTLTFNITFTNYATGTGANHTQPLTIIVQVYRRGAGTAFYLDGVNGSNSNKGKHPNDAVKSLSTIFNRCGYLAGDVVYVVNKVTANNALSWNGLPYNNVTLYRYNGGHELKKVDGIATPIVDNPNNDSYKGELLVVKNDVTVTGITLDGYYRTGTKGEAPESSVTATASLVTVANGGVLELGSGTVLQNNNSSSINGAAVNVADGGKLMMNQDATIKNNLTSGDGAGVYMDGTMVVSDNVQIIDNMKGTMQNNVYLTGAEKVITIGTTAGNDAYGELGNNAKIGVTKTLTEDVDGYTRVVNVDEEVDVAWLETPYNTHPNSIIYHDGGKYQLEKFSDRRYLYWVGTWVTLQNEKPNDEQGGWAYGDDITSVTSFDITTEYQFAWIISLVNGENGQPGNDFSGKTINILKDIDMDESTWVPIGTSRHPFKGTINGNGHLIENMHSSLVLDNMGMLGVANGATVQNVMTMVDFNANSANVGSVAGTMTSTTISNVEAAGTIAGGSNTVNVGGIVGEVTSGTIHSSFAVNTIKAQRDETVVGGLVGDNSGDLYNSYANVTITGSTNTPIGGLAGVNKGNIENCYAVVGTQTFPAFAHTNSGSIALCYADKDNGYVKTTETGGTLSGHGTYGAVLGRKALGYMYNDNAVTLASGQSNSYVASALSYNEDKTQIEKWPGLLSSLNQWVAAKGGDYSTWNRPTSADINGDLPVLAFPSDNCLGTTDGKFLHYGAYNPEDLDNNNGLDNLLGTVYASKEAYIYLYGNATKVKSGTGSNHLFIHEDAALLQDQGSKAEIKATVGITFDNSCKTAQDWFETDLNYDWHLMSTPLSDAPLGINYTDGAQTGYGKPADWSEVTESSYMPTMTNSKDGVTWDFYTYYEPEYHWINFKRSKNNHWHYDEPNDPISYNGAEQPDGNLVKGKGYMMAISQDSYLSATGTLNNGKVDITLTRSGNLPEELGANDESKDWGSNLLGNPYQAYLDLEAVDETGFTTFYVYIAEENQYKPYTIGSSKNTYAPSRYLHPHQAFFVLMTEKEEDTFTFTYDMATANKDENLSYFRKGGDHKDYPLINLFVNDEKGARNYTTIEVGRPELGGAQKTDALKTTNFDLYARYEQNDYKLLFTPAEAERVAVCFKPGEDGTYTLTWDTQNGEFSFLRLIDNISGVECDMLNNDHYTFEGSPYDYASRFYILFNNPNEDDPNNGHNNNGNGFAYYDGYGWIVNGEGIIELVDVTGRVLYTEMLHGDMNRISLDGFTPGVYVLMLGDKTQKIVIK